MLGTVVESLVVSNVGLRQQVFHLQSPLGRRMFQFHIKLVTLGLHLLLLEIVVLSELLLVLGL